MVTFCYEDAWENGPKIPIFIKDSINREDWPSDRIGYLTPYTLESGTTTFPEFDQSITMICFNNADMPSYFTSQLLVTVGKRYYFAPDTYIVGVSGNGFPVDFVSPNERWRISLIGAYGKFWFPSYNAPSTVIQFRRYSPTQFCVVSLTEFETEAFAEFYSRITIVSNDPYAQGGESDVGGGTGDFDGTSVDVDFTSLPTLSAVDTGFITLYNPTVAQLQSLANYMWSGAFDLDTFKKLFADPMQAILGLSIVPGPVPSSGAQAVKVGNISTGISMTKAASQYIDIDCGTLNVEEFWGAYLDYEPYTKAEIYLPYIGTHQIAVDDIMGKAVHIKYHIDILSGACAAEIKCGGSVLYTFIGSVAVSIPVTGNDWTNVINGVLSIAGAVGSLVATGGAAAPAAAGEIASAAVNSLKPNIEKSGAVSGGGGLMAGKVPVLILTRPRQALPASQNEYTGYPAFITRSLGAVSGYTEVHKIRLGGISATDAELDEIENLLKGGVIL